MNPKAHQCFLCGGFNDLKGTRVERSGLRPEVGSCFRLSDGRKKGLLPPSKRLARRLSVSLSFLRAVLHSVAAVSNTR